MAEVREIESTQKKILDLVDRSDKDPRKDVTLFTNHKTDALKNNSANRNALRDIDLPKRRAVSLERKSCTRKLKSKFGRFHSVSSSYEHTDQKVEGLNTNTKTIPSLLDLVIPTPHPDFLKMNISFTRQFKPKRGNIHTASSNPKSYTITKAIPSLLDLVIPTPHPDFLKMNISFIRQFKSKQGIVPTGSSNPKSYTITKTIPSLLDLVIPTPHPDFLKMNISFIKQFKSKRGIVPTVLRNPKEENQQIAAQKSNLRKETLSYNSDKGRRHANPCKLNQLAKESKPIQGKPSSVSSKAEIGNNKQQRSANVMVINSTINGGNPFPSADVLEGNTKFSALQSKCENTPASSLQVSPTPQELEPRLDRLARFLSLSIRPWFQIVDTAQHDNNDNIVQHDGLIQQESNEGCLPDTILELEPDGGPFTPELYRDESCGWNWPLADIPEWTILGSGQHL